MNIYIMRHGQTNFNVLGLCNDDPGRDVYLTSEGMVQAVQAANELKQAPIEVIFVSQLPRTRQTAQFINTYHSAPVIEAAALNDIRSGFDGKPVSDYFALCGHDRMNIVPPGGESLKQYQIRINGFIDELLKHDYETVLIVAHEETLRVVAARFDKLSDEQMQALSFDNCAYICFSTKYSQQSLA